MISAIFNFFREILKTWTRIAWSGDLGHGRHVRWPENFIKFKK